MDTPTPDTDPAARELYQRMVEIMAKPGMGILALYGDLEGKVSWDRASEKTRKIILFLVDHSPGVGTG